MDEENIEHVIAWLTCWSSQVQPKEVGVMGKKLAKITVKIDKAKEVKQLSRSLIKIPGKQIHRVKKSWYDRRESKKIPND